MRRCFHYCYWGCLAGSVFITLLHINDSDVKGLIFILPIAAYAIASLIPAALLTLTLLLLTRSGRRVVRANPQRPAFFIGASDGVLLALPFLPVFNHYLYRLGSIADLLRFAIYIFLPSALAILLTQRRIQRGLCRVCGYDLRAHKPGQRCPECGTMIEAGKEMNA